MQVHQLQNQSFKSFNSNDENYTFLLLGVVREKRVFEPYEELMLAVLQNGILTALDKNSKESGPYDFKNIGKNQFEAIRWIQDDDEWLFSFKFLCEHFNLPYDKIRNKVLNNESIQC